MCWIPAYFHPNSPQDASASIFQRRKLAGWGRVFWTEFRMNDNMLGLIPYMISFHFKWRSMSLSQLVHLFCPTRLIMCWIISSSLIVLTSFVSSFLSTGLSLYKLRPNPNAKLMNFCLTHAMKNSKNVIILCKYGLKSENMFPCKLSRFCELSRELYSHVSWYTHIDYFPSCRFLPHFGKLFLQTFMVCEGLLGGNTWKEYVQHGFWSIN